MRFGAAEGPTIRLTDLRLSDTGSVGAGGQMGTAHGASAPVPGAHNAMNALIALAVCDALGADVAEAAMALAAWEPVSGRGTRERLDLGGAGDLVIELIDDAFNANPASLGRARRAGGHRSGPGRAGAWRSWATCWNWATDAPDDPRRGRRLRAMAKDRHRAHRRAADGASAQRAARVAPGPACRHGRGAGP
jgi:hypothetical protein